MGHVRGHFPNVKYVLRLQLFVSDFSNYPPTNVNVNMLPTGNLHTEHGKQRNNSALI